MSAEGFYICSIIAYIHRTNKHIMIILIHPTWRYMVHASSIQGFVKIAKENRMCMSYCTHWRVMLYIAQIFSLYIYIVYSAVRHLTQPMTQVRHNYCPPATIAVALKTAVTVVSPTATKTMAKCWTVHHLTIVMKSLLNANHVRRYVATAPLLVL